MKQVPRPIRVVIADDDPIVRDLVSRLLRRSSRMQIVGEATDGSEAIVLCEKTVPDILLVDMLMPQLPGIDALRELTARKAPVRSIVLCAFIGKRQILQALQLGARGIVLKRSVDVLVKAIEAVMGGHFWVENREISSLDQVIANLVSAGAAEEQARQPYGLTKREMEVISLVTIGKTNREIGQALAISEETVKRHLVNIFDKTGMSTRLEVAMLAVDRHLVGI